MKKYMNTRKLAMLLTFQLLLILSFSFTVFAEPWTDLFIQCPNGQGYLCNGSCGTYYSGQYNNWECQAYTCPENGEPSACWCAVFYGGQTVSYGENTCQRVTP